ncbi:hypothetical protein SDC9_116533 [bioreactor metagenome]|uniref:Uncharacterized protein n=1 Tax=bioreactor metagenome TaxID=1076179 RepID=A0A645BWF8_9ZZZZ
MLGVPFPYRVKHVSDNRIVRHSSKSERRDKLLGGSGHDHFHVVPVLFQLVDNFYGFVAGNSA